MSPADPPPDVAETGALASFGEHLDPALVVITAADGAERAGCLVGFHSQCSIGPDRYAVWLSKANHTYRVGMLAEVFAVHFLGAEDRPETGPDQPLIVGQQHPDHCCSPVVTRSRVSGSRARTR